jgi:predicted nucleotidyltransferase
MRLGVSFNQYCVSILNQRGHISPQPADALQLVTDLQPLVDAVRKELSERVIGVVLFGSLARGQAREHSDIDLLVVLSSDANFDRDLYDQLPYRTHLGRPVSYNVVRLPGDIRRASSLWFEVAVDGVVLFDLGLALSRTLGALRRLLLEGQFRRRSSYGVGYWERAPSPRGKET